MLLRQDIDPGVLIAEVDAARDEIAWPQANAVLANRDGPADDGRVGDGINTQDVARERDVQAVIRTAETAEVRCRGEHPR
jgi:hypothetical protein